MVGPSSEFVCKNSLLVERRIIYLYVFFVVFCFLCVLFTLKFPRDWFYDFIFKTLYKVQFIQLGNI